GVMTADTIEAIVREMRENGSNPFATGVILTSYCKDWADRLEAIAKQQGSTWREAVMDGNSVYEALSLRAKKFVSVDCVCEVLDAVAKVARSAAPQPTVEGE
ncbi:MAG TPA: hypothetical protein VJ809_04580, partial [Pirellulales bacterium]|nr:hypothetical protein [Pirellulales bacterium]